MQKLAINRVEFLQPQLPMVTVPNLVDLLGFDPADLIQVPDIVTLLDPPTVARVEGFGTGVVRSMPTTNDLEPDECPDAESLRKTIPLLAAVFVLIYPVMLETTQADAEEVIRSLAWSAALALLVLMLRGAGDS